MTKISAVYKIVNTVTGDCYGTRKTAGGYHWEYL